MIKSLQKIVILFIIWVLYYIHIYIPFWYHMTNKTKAEFILSTDTLAGYGLDLIFETAKEAGFDGIDLAIWKNFDAWNVDYVKKLSKKHDLPVRVIQTSANINNKEMNLALDLCEATGADTIAINAPKVLDFKPYAFIKDNIKEYINKNSHIHFSIINPKDSTIFALPIPKYRFANIVEIIKKYSSYLWLDIANMDEESLENEFIRKIDQFVQYISVLYLSDKTKLWQSHVLPGDWTLKLIALLKKLKEYKFSRYFSLKLDISKVDLADADKVLLMLKKAKKYYEEYFVDVDVDK